jgi:colanic acid/amylovoran biosynthesis glycosyltransferase
MRAGVPNTSPTTFAGSRMKVVHVFKQFPQRYHVFSTQLVRRLAAAGVECCVVSKYRANDPDPDAAFPFPVRYLDDGALRLVGVARRAYRAAHGWKCAAAFVGGFSTSRSRLHALATIGAIGRERPDVIHVHHIQACSAEIFAAAAALSCPVLITVRGYDVMVAPLMSEATARRTAEVLTSASAVHALGSGLRQRVLSMGVDEGRVHLIPYSLETSEPGSAPAGLGRPFILTSIGRLVWEKGHLYAVDAVALLLRSGVPVEYHLVGDGPMEEAIRFRAWQLGITEHVKLRGFFGPSALDEHLSRTHVVVHPSLTEGLGVSLIRSQAAGVPVVATDVGGIPDVVEHGRTGYLVPPADPSHLRDAIAKLLSDEAGWKRMSHIATTHARSRFDTATEIRSIVDLYGRLANGRGEAPLSRPPDAEAKALSPAGPSGTASWTP